MKLIIKGRAFSKKNSRRIFRRGGYIANLPSSAYERFEKETLIAMRDEGLIEPTGDKAKPYKALGRLFNEEVYINYVFHLKGLGNQDGDNIQAGINDILQVAGIIENDKLIREWQGKVVIHSPEWFTEVEIIPLKDLHTLTAPPIYEPQNNQVN